MSAMRHPLATVILMAGLTGCRAEPPPQGVDDASPPELGADGNLQGQVYERAVVFTTSVGDSTLIVPWLFGARTRPGGVTRTARAWLARGGEWEPFFQESWETPPTRVPWRLHPRGGLRLVVGEGEALEALLFEEGRRRLEVEIGGTRAEWNGSQGETFTVADGAAVLSEQRLPGLVLDFARAHRGESPPPGDWMFLISGDSLQVVLSGKDEPSAAGGTLEGWGATTGCERDPVAGRLRLVGGDPCLRGGSPRGTGPLEPGNRRWRDERGSRGENCSHRSGRG